MSAKRRMSQGCEQLLDALSKTTSEEISLRCGATESAVARWARGEETPSLRHRAMLREHVWTVTGPWGDEDTIPDVGVHALLRRKIERFEAEARERERRVREQKTLIAWKQSPHPPLAGELTEEQALVGLARIESWVHRARDVLGCADASEGEVADAISATRKINQLLSGIRIEGTTHHKTDLRYELVNLIARASGTRGDDRFEEEDVRSAYEEFVRGAEEETPELASRLRVHEGLVITAIGELRRGLKNRPIATLIQVLDDEIRPLSKSQQDSKCRVYEEWLAGTKIPWVEKSEVGK